VGKSMLLINGDETMRTAQPRGKTTQSLKLRSQIVQRVLYRSPIENETRANRKRNRNSFVDRKPIGDRTTTN
jgi:hypothetical protein